MKDKRERINALPSLPLSFTLTPLSDADLAMEAIQILPATDADLPAISALAGDIWRECYVSVISSEQIEYMLKWMYDPSTMLRESREGVRYQKILVDHSLAGFAAWGPYPSDPATCKLHKLYVLASVRGRGVGSHALRHVMTAAAAAGFSRIVLNVNKKNTRAIAAYKRNGFLVLREVCDPIGNGFVMDDFVMGRTF
jgi:ribosomal protein S18 acetylase RimI-like enzyme